MALVRGNMKNLGGKGKLNYKKTLIKHLVIIYMLAISLLATIQCYGADNQSVIRYNYPEAGFSITIPRDWKEIPEELSKQQTSNNTDDIIHTGFNLKSGQTYPGIDLSLNTTMEISDDYLKRLPQIKNGQIFTKEENNCRKYDASTHTMWQIMSGEQPGYGKFCSVSAMRITAKGVIITTMVLQAEQYTEYFNEFRQIVNSIKIRKEQESPSGLALYELVKKIVFGISLFAILATILLVLIIKANGKRRTLKMDNAMNTTQETDGDN